MSHKFESLYAFARRNRATSLEGRLGYFAGGATLYLLVACFAAAIEAGVNNSTGWTTFWWVWTVLSAIHLLWLATTGILYKTYYLSGLTEPSVKVVKAYESLPKTTRAQFPNLIQTVRRLEDANGGCWSSLERRRASPQYQLAAAVDDLARAETEKQAKLDMAIGGAARDDAEALITRIREEAEIARKVTEELQ